MILALLWGEGEFDRSMTIVNSLGWDTDCNSGNVGCVLGVALGLEAFEGGDWRGPVADRLYVPGAEGGRAISDAVGEADRIVRAAREVRGLGGYAPKGGARFHWSYPGSVQGWAGACEPVEAGLRVSGSAETPTWYSEAALANPTGYEMVGSPTLYPGQTVRVSLSGGGRPFARARGVEEPLYGPVLDGSAEWTVPEASGPIWAFGFEGEATLDSVDWGGTPRAAFGRGTAIERAQWASSLDRNEGTLLKNRGVGVATVGDRTWGDARATMRITPRMPCGSGLVLRFQGLRRYYAFVVAPDGRGGGEARIERMAYGRQTLASAPVAVAFDGPGGFELSASAVGDRLALSVDGRVVVEARDGTFSGGGAGVWVESGSVDAGPLRVEPA